jgi:hypothetical protein
MNHLHKTERNNNNMLRHHRFAKSKLTVLARALCSFRASVTMQSGVDSVITPSSAITFLK